MRKIVTLKNELVAYLDITSTQNSYSIYASDIKGNLIGQCLFNIEYGVTRKLTEKERELYARNHKIPLSEVPTKIKSKPEGIEKYFSEGRKTITLANGKEYCIEEIKCSLLQIEILDERFFSVGLGQAMHNKMLETAKKYNCTKIHAFCYPHGNFLFGTQAFYKRNGYTFSTEGGMTYVTKDLCKTKSLIENTK